mmetsp:Transcript_5085/g.3737  ORF Transcript_5085/g.3737 Transcript_5085/m.3737 type:complete len:92 (-) Transcript_5085:53-328(-)
MSLEPPSFLTNDVLLFLSEDNIVMGYDIVKQEQFLMVSNCSFPGSNGKVNLKSMLWNEGPETGHLYGENSLFYTKVKDQEFIGTNYYNDLF